MHSPFRVHASAQLLRSWAGFYIFGMCPSWGMILSHIPPKIEQIWGRERIWFYRNVHDFKSMTCNILLWPTIFFFTFCLLLFPVDCIPGPWSQWSVCSRNGRTCGYKWGVQTRTRQILQPPSPNGQACTALSRSQRCRLATRWCSGKFVGVACCSFLHFHWREDVFSARSIASL